MNADLRDVFGGREANVRPGLSAIDRFIDAVAGHDVAADAGLAHADVHDVGARLAHGHGADRRALDLAVGDWRPRLAAVRRLPQSAAHRAEIRVLRTSAHAAHGDRASAAIGADRAPFI